MRQAMTSILLWPVAMVLFAAGVTLYVVVPSFVIAGAGIALFDVWWLTALAERIPPDKLSRVTSYDWMVSLSLMPLGYLLAGPLGDALGSQEVLLGGSALGLLALAASLLSREIRTLERLPGDAATRLPGASLESCEAAMTTLADDHCEEYPKGTPPLSEHEAAQLRGTCPAGSARAPRRCGGSSPSTTSGTPSASSRAPRWWPSASGTTPTSSSAGAARRSS